MHVEREEDINTNQVPFAFDTTEFLRFVILSFLTAPPNFKWQQLLERLFPAYETASSTLLPLTHLDKKEDTQEEDDPTQAKRKLNIKNTLTKWFIDCMTFGALLNTVAFLVLIGILKGQSKDQIVNHVRTVSTKPPSNVVQALHYAPELTQTELTRARTHSKSL